MRDTLYNVSHVKLTTEHYALSCKPLIVYFIVCSLCEFHSLAIKYILVTFL